MHQISCNDNTFHSSYDIGRWEVNDLGKEKIISMSDDMGTESNYCDCGNKLSFQSEWSRLSDSHDSNTPSFDLIYLRIYKEDREPKYVCDNCGTTNQERWGICCS